VKQGSTLPVMGTASSRPLKAAGATPALRMIAQATSSAAATRQASSACGMSTAPGAMRRRGIATPPSASTASASRQTSQAGRPSCGISMPRPKKARLASASDSHQGQRVPLQAKVTRCATVAGRHTSVASAMARTPSTGVAHSTKPMIGPAIIGRPASVPPTAWPKRLATSDDSSADAATSSSFSNIGSGHPGTP